MGHNEAMDLQREVLPSRKKRNHERILMFVFAILAIAGVGVGTLSVMQLRSTEADIQKVKDSCRDQQMPPLGGSTVGPRIDGRWTF